MCELHQTLADASGTPLVGICSLRPTLCGRDTVLGTGAFPRDTALLLWSEKPDKPENFCVHAHENPRWWQVLTDGLLRSFLRENI